jgi:hypothetical protein
MIQEDNSGAQSEKIRKTENEAIHKYKDRHKDEEEKRKMKEDKKKNGLL